MDKIKIAIVDDHGIVRKGLKQLIEETGYMLVILEASDIRELISKLEYGDLPAILLLDVNLPGISGLDAIPMIRERFGCIKIVMMSMYPLENYEMRALKLGAWFCIPKEEIHETIITVLDVIHNAKEPIISIRTEKIIAQIDYLPKDPTSVYQ